MARGPLPDPQRRRRNAPTIPTTSLPASGRAGPAPACPYELGAAGGAWWVWAWGLPQACAWSDGDLYVVARRARLEDDVALRAPVVHDDLAVLLEGADEVAIEAVEAAILTLRRLATGKLAVEKEMRELDGKLGLSPEALAKLRWSIVDEGVDDAPAAPARPGGTVRNLRAVDPKLADEHQAS